ncbi:unnamed protein product, partial [Candidula unifasciata]
MVRQVALLPAGCQPWNYDVVSVSGSRFAYAASLAIYIYELDHKYSEYRLLSIMSEHKGTVTCICWCPEKPDYLASSSLDGTVIIWDVTKQEVVARHNHKEAVCNIGWTLDQQQCLTITGKNGPIWLWCFQNSQNLSIVKETQSFASPVTLFRWHHAKTSQVAVGHENGSVSFVQMGEKVQKHVFKPDPATDNDNLSDPVVVLEWDPLSTDYLLICNRLEGIQLVDVPNLKTIMLFQLPSAASNVQTLTWVKSAAGMFVTGDSKGGILRIWNVSNPLPIENMKIKGTGFHRLEVLNQPIESVDSSLNTAMASESKDKSLKHISSTSKAESMAFITQSHVALPHIQVVCAFKDGGIGLYHISRRKWIFLRNEGHIETIFDCKFSPENPDYLATSSFDGTVKIWDITTMTCLTSSPGNEGVIYHISWAPADLNCIAACTAKQGAFIWDVGKGKIINRFNHHSLKDSVYCVAWNHIDPKLIMTCGGDGLCIIQQVDGRIVKKYKHPSPVFGCDWSPFNKDMLATGCEDKILRIFYLVSSSDQPIRVLAGHEAKVFHIRWNPLKEGILCSGSDDGNIRVWDYTKDQCVCVLSGHKNRVRGLNWNSEIANFLASGSWDFTIRIWDTQDGACLCCLLDHGADVYGLTSHPSRPFLLASSSRDTTVRLWSVSSLAQSIELSLLAGKPCQEIIGEPAVCGLSSPVLAGHRSRTLFRDLTSKTGDQTAMWGRISKFFAHASGVTNLWDLVYIIQGKDTLLSTSYAKGIVHRKHVTIFKGSEAQQLEMIKMSKFGAGVGAPSREDRLTEAANIHIKLGNVQRYCELMVELGKWERALALAPSVSLKYWQQLNQRYCAALSAEDNDMLVPACIAGGDVDRLVSFFTSRGQLADAMLVAQSAFEGSIPHTDFEDQQTSTSRGQGDDKEHFNRLTVEVLEKLSDFYFANGSPTLAACCHLASDEQKRAMSKLIRGHELELAVYIGRVLGGAPQETDIALELLSRRCEALGKWELGLDLLQLQTRSSLQQAKLCARCSSSMAEINALHYKAGLPSMEECETKGKALQSSPADVVNCVMFYLLSPACEKGLQIGLQHIRDKMKLPDWSVDDVFPLLQLLGCIKTEKLQHARCSSMIFELLALSAYIGALVAMKRQYYQIVGPLLAHAKVMMQKGNVKLSVSQDQIDETCMVFKAAIDNRLTPELEPLYKTLMQHFGSLQDWALELGPDCAGSSNLPSHSDIQVSVLSGDRIKGQAFFLEDGQSAISLNEALMWAKVNPFSPLGSGVRINPF